MRPNKKLIATFALIPMLLSACSESADPSSNKDSPVATQEAPDHGEAMDGVASFDLTSSERLRMEEKANNGNGIAAFKLYQFWGMTGGTSSSSKQQRDRKAIHWLRVAAAVGNESAIHDLAVRTANEDCGKARKSLGQLSTGANDPNVRTSAKFWLRGETLCAGGRAAK